MLFNWFKKKDKLEPLKPPESGKPGRLERKPFIRPAMPAAPKHQPPSKDTSKIKTSESAVIRIGKLGEVLLQYNMVSRENLEKALALQQQQEQRPDARRKLLGEILIENNLITEEQLLSAFARHCRIPYIKINKYELPKSAVQSVPVDLIIKHKVLPVDKIGSVLMLAVTDPYNTAAVEEVTAKTGLKIKTILCKQSEFEEMVKFYYPGGNDASKEHDSKPAAAAEEAIQSEPAPAQEAEAVGEKTSVFKIAELPFPEPPAGYGTAPRQEAIVTEKPQPAGPGEVSPLVPTEEQKDVPPERKWRQGATAGTETAPEPAVSRQEPQAPPAPTPDIPRQNRGRPADSESFLGGTIENTAHPKEKPEPEPAPKIPARPDDHARSGGAAERRQGAAPATEEINGYDSSLIDISDLLSSQKASEDENIEIITEEPEPIDMAPYIYPEEEKSKEAIVQAPEIPAATQRKKEDAPVASTAEEPRHQTAPETPVPKISEPKPDKPIPLAPPAVTENALVIVSEDEFLVAQQLFSEQMAPPWEKLYHRGKPSQAERVDETEFAFYTENAIL